MSSYAHSSHVTTELHAPQPASALALAPGKRTLTQDLPASSRTLSEETRAVADMDDGAGDDFYDERETVDARMTETGLTDRQIARARRKNPGWIRRLKVSAQILSNADPDSSAFALDVADHQAANGLTVDGIAGPVTVRTIAAKVARKRGPDRGADRERSGDDRFASDDPFGMHLLGST